MATQTKEILELNNLDITADKGYDSAMEIKKCIDNNINPIVPRSKKEHPNKDKFARDKFIYDKEQDCYICPNNQRLIKSSTVQNKKGKINFLYRGESAECKTPIQV